MSFGINLLAKAKHTQLFKRAAATLCHFKGETARRDRLVTEIAMDKLAGYAKRHGVKNALFKPTHKFQHELTAFSFGSLWLGMVNQPSDFQKRGIVAAARPIMEQMRLDGVAMQLSVVNGGRFGFTDRTPAVLEASFRPLAAQATPGTALQHG